MDAAIIKWTTKDNPENTHLKLVTKMYGNAKSVPQALWGATSQPSTMSLEEVYEEGLRDLKTGGIWAGNEDSIIILERHELTPEQKAEIAAVIL